MATATTMRQLLEAGVHFGHQTRRWNPNMRPFIFGERNGIHILDLAQTVPEAPGRRSTRCVKSPQQPATRCCSSAPRSRRARSSSAKLTRCGMPYVNNRWLGGTLTNFQTISKPHPATTTSSATRFADRSGARSRSSRPLRLQPPCVSLRQTKRERLMLQKEYERLTRAFSGVRSLERPPGAVFIVDPSMEEIAVREANRARIPIIAMCDTNANPDVIDFRCRRTTTRSGRSG